MLLRRCIDTILEYFGEACSSSDQKSLKVIVRRVVRQMTTVPQLDLYLASFREIRRIIYTLQLGVIPSEFRAQMPWRWDRDGEKECRDGVGKGIHFVERGGVGIKWCSRVTPYYYSPPFCRWSRTEKWKAVCNTWNRGPCNKCDMPYTRERERERERRNQRCGVAVAVV